MLVVFYSVAFGMIFSGILTSLFGLLTAKPAGFSIISADSAPKVIAATVFLIFSGPVILMRNSLLGVIREGYPKAALALSVLVAGYWSFLTGLSLLAIVISLI